MIFKNTIFILILMLLVSILFAQKEPENLVNYSNLEVAIKDTIMHLNIPLRSQDAMEGTDFTKKITGLSIKDREIAIVNEILSGNVPSFSRKLRPLKINQTIASVQYEFIFYTVCDYMAVGSEQDYLYVPMTPATAQYLANQLDCSLPTSKIVDIIYAKAGLKLHPQPIPPSDKMTTVPVFSQHTDSIKHQIYTISYDRSADSLIAGHKKDIIISKKIYSPDRNYDRVVIYGWHLSENNPIQPIYNGHYAFYADYSHGVRLISNLAYINGDSCKVTDILQDANLSALMSNEGEINKPYYPESDFFSSIWKQSEDYPKEFKLYQNYPNPFPVGNRSAFGGNMTTINYFLAKESAVKLSVYNVKGCKISDLIDENQQAGEYHINFNGMNLANGVYYYKISTGDFEKTKKMLIVK